MNWKDIALGLVVSRLEKSSKVLGYYQDFQKLNRARREYERQRKKGKSAVEALKKVALESGIPQTVLAEHLKDKTGDFGELPISDVLAGTIYGRRKDDAKN